MFRFRGAVFFRTALRFFFFAPAPFLWVRDFFPDDSARLFLMPLPAAIAPCNHSARPREVAVNPCARTYIYIYRFVSVSVPSTRIVANSHCILHTAAKFQQQMRNVAILELFGNRQGRYSLTIGNEGICTSPQQ